jgi:hypothetical protein
MTVVTPDTAAPRCRRSGTSPARLGLDLAAEGSDLDGPSIEHLARAERVQLLGLAIEEIVNRSRHAHEQPGGQPLIEVQAAEQSFATTRLRQLVRWVRATGTATTRSVTTQPALGHLTNASA